MSKELSSFVVSPLRDGTKLWRKVSAIGASVAIENTNYKFQGSTGSANVVPVDLKYARVRFFYVDFGLTGTGTPSLLNNNISFGLAADWGAGQVLIQFSVDKVGNQLQLLVQDENAQSQTINVPWRTSNPNFNDGQVIWEILWTSDKILFLIDRRVFGEFKSTPTAKIPQTPLNVFAATDGTDKLIINLIEVDDAEQMAIVPHYASYLSPVLLSAGQRTASGNGLSFDLKNTKELVVTLDVSAASGTTPTLDVKLQHSPDGVKWSDLGTAFGQKTGVSREVKVFTQYHQYVRTVYTIGGTSPNFTFSVEATAKE